MHTLRALSRTFFFTIILGLLAAPHTLLAQNQTNDPLVDEQQYLFDVHNVDQAWSYTTGSSNVRLGVYSFLGFTSNHEDLNGPRLETPRGPLRPGYDYATEVAGIAGAVTNNNLGVAGIDRAGELQSYSMLYTNPSGHEDEEEVTVDGETFYLDLLRVADRFREGRNNGVDVHLSLIGVPTGLDVDYEEDPLPIDTTNYPPMLPNPDSLAPDPDMDIESGEIAQRRAAFQTLRDLFLNVWLNTCLIGCDKPPPPAADFRQAIGNATRLDGDIVVTPTGDLAGPTTTSNLPVSPGRLGRYVVTVGGLEYESGQGSNLVKWERSTAAPYIDVAGFATGLVGPAAMGFSAYNTEFTGTAGAAGIGAGVASLLRAENPNFTSEDVEQILRRTAKDVGAPGFDTATGAGRIDAGAALDYVNNNDVQRSTKSPSTILFKQTVSSYTDVTLEDEGYLAYSGECNAIGATADLKKFQARVPYEETFSVAPDVWVRWSGSNGYKTSRNDDVGAYAFDQFGKGLEVVDVKGHHFVVEGYYWVANFSTLAGDCPGDDIRIPKKPSNFNIAYTAVGTEGQPPVYDVSISGPTTLDEGEQGTWTASPSPSNSNPSYTWFADEGGGWYYLGTGSTLLWGKDNISSTLSVDIKVEASERGETVSAQTSVIINNNDGGGGCNAPGGNQLCLGVDGNSLIVQNVRAKAQNNSTAHVSWQASGSDIPTEFVVQHRADSTAAWSTLGAVSAGDSSSVDSSRAVAYRFRTDRLEVGTHQFRVGLPQNTDSGPRAVGTSRDDNPQRFTGPVTAEVKMDEAYRLSTYPNPVRGRATVELAVKERQEVAVRLYDVLGRQVATFHSGPLPAQEMRRLRLDVSSNGLTSGTYFLRVRGEDFAATEQVTVVR